MALAAGLSLRPVRPDDFAALKAMHIQLFPIIYSDEFFAKAVCGIGLFNRPLFSLIATSLQDTGECVVGFLLAQMIARSDIEEGDVLEGCCSEACYILTLGLDPARRRSGLGCELLGHCVNFARSSPSCGMVCVCV